MKKRIVPVMVVVVLVAAGAWLWWFCPRPFYYAGTLEATEVTLSARVASVISDITVKEGETCPPTRP